MANRAMPATFFGEPQRRSSAKHRLQLHALVACRVRAIAPLRPNSPRLEGLVGIEENCDRTLIRQLHRHHSLKDAGGHGDAELAQSIAKYFVKRSGFVRRSGRDEARAPTAARVAVQS